MDPRSAQELGDEVRILDVREPFEWDAGHIAGAVHIPLGEIPDRVEELSRSDRLLVTCAAGARSAAASAFLKEKGFEVDNLDGGLVAWEQAGLPVVTDDGSPGIVAVH